jgi:hypothetical protein
MKKVSLDKNSWHFKYYSLVTGNETPKTLCPYFWTMVILVLLSPVILFIVGIAKLVSYISKFVNKNKPVKVYDEVKEQKKRLRSVKLEKIFEIIAKVVLGFLLLVFVSLIIYAFYDTVGKIGWFQLLKSVFAVIGLCTSVTLITLGLVEVRIGRLIMKTKFMVGLGKMLSVIKSMVIAVYTKSCPLVEWGDSRLVTTEDK